jgi:hypothetical protein
MRRKDGRDPDRCRELSADALRGLERYATAKLDRNIGEPWVELGDGKLRFAMVTDKQWVGIEEVPE